MTTKVPRMKGITNPGAEYNNPNGPKNKTRNICIPIDFFFIVSRSQINIVQV